MTQKNSNKPMSTAGSYEDQKNNGNRKTDESIGGAEKGGAGLSRAQNRMPPESEKLSTLEKNKPKSTN